MVPGSRRPRTTSNLTPPESRELRRGGSTIFFGPSDEWPLAERKRWLFARRRRSCRLLCSSTYVDDMKMAGRTASLAPIPEINQMYLGCTQRESITEESNMQLSQEKLEESLQQFSGEDLRICPLDDRDRFLEESVSRKFQHHKHVCKNDCLSPSFSSHKSNDRDQKKWRKAKPSKKRILLEGWQIQSEHLVECCVSDGSVTQQHRSWGKIFGHWFENGRITCANVVGIVIDVKLWWRRQSRARARTCVMFHGRIVWTWTGFLKEPIWFRTISVTYVHTERQMADILTKGSFTREKWNELLILLDIVPESFHTCSAAGEEKPSVYWRSLQTHKCVVKVKTGRKSQLKKRPNTMSKARGIQARHRAGRLHFLGVLGPGDLSHGVQKSDDPS